MRMLSLFFAFYLIFQGTAAADVFGLKMGDPMPENRYKNIQKLANGSEELTLKKQLGPGRKGGERTKAIRLIYTDGGLSEFYMHYFGHGNNLAQSSEDYTRIYNRICKLLELDPEKYGKHKYSAYAEVLGPNHRFFKSFDPEHNPENICEIEIILGPEGQEYTDTMVHMAFKNSKNCGKGPVFKLPSH